MPIPGSALAGGTASASAPRNHRDWVTGAVKIRTEEDAKARDGHGGDNEECPRAVVERTGQRPHGREDDSGSSVQERLRRCFAGRPRWRGYARPWRRICAGGTALPATGFPTEEDDACQDGERAHCQTDDDKIQRLSRIPNGVGLRPRPSTRREIMRGILRGGHPFGQVMTKSERVHPGGWTLSLSLSDDRPGAQSRPGSQCV